MSCKDFLHVAKILCTVVDKTRQMEIMRIPRNDRKSVHSSRWLWLYGSQNLHGSRAEKLEIAKLVLPQTIWCWVMKELAQEVGVPLLTSAVRTLLDRLYKMLNAMKYRVSKSSAESPNSKIRLLRIKARDYSNKERFWPAVMFHYGSLDMASETSHHKRGSPFYENYYRVDACMPGNDDEVFFCSALTLLKFYRSRLYCNLARSIVASSRKLKFTFPPFCQRSKLHRSS
ncbi:transposase [Pantoea allii]|uniref:Transposase n=1 Tax=Pantoea allii TaxID=574096 RepID=A0A2V2BDG4_9GAMM|nr:transposase [Pantoea allii]